MRTIRIIPRLDIKGANLVKGIHLEGLRVLGLPERFSTNYFQNGADELIYIDSVASLYGRNNLENIVRRTAENVFIPITVGGGIRTVDDIRRLLRAGADKIAINTAAVNNPLLITESAKAFGSQCIVLSIEAMRCADGKYEAYTDNGREPTGKDVIEWAQEAVDLGAGEILITSIDQEGTGRGYDIELVSKIVDAVSVPVIGCGGAGNIKHIENLICSCEVDAVCAASIFHYNILSKFGVEKREEGNIEYLKNLLGSSNIILKRLDPISVSDLKKYLRKTDICSIQTGPSDNFQEEKENIKSEVSVKTQRKLSKVVLVDYGRSNLFSVEHALTSLGVKVDITNDARTIERADKLIVAGVGAFGDVMRRLRGSGVIDPIREFVAKGKPILGICLGMQLFMSQGYEFGFTEGLSLIKGKVVKLEEDQTTPEDAKIPHIGWNQIKYPGHDEKGRRWADAALLRDINNGDSVYFVHSYVVIPDDSGCIVAETKHGTNSFCSIIMQDNIIGCQFHPEKSGLTGLIIFRNFVLNF